MNKILLIIKREYLTRVRKKTFIISTILFPLLYLALIFGGNYITSKSGRHLKVAIIDSSGFFNKEAIEIENRKDSSSTLILENNNSETVRQEFEKRGYDGYIVVPQNLDWEAGAPQLLTLNAGRTISIEGTQPVRNKLNAIWSRIKNERLGINETQKAILEKNVIAISPFNVNDQSADSGMATLIGIVSGLLIYFILIIYGSQVMMGVMEEKTNRIAEVVVSSVRPFQLMLGKIIGIGMVALSQFLLWIIFIFVIYNVTSSAGGNIGSMSGMIGNIQKAFTSVNVVLIVSCFVFYMLGGFFFYSSLYAAIGSAVNEDMREAQSLSFPVTMLVIISIIMLSAVIKDPTGPIAVWGSIIPFSSPIIMMTRLPFGVPGTVPVWQLVASMATLILGFILTTWFAGKIYRTGILMYGKKPSWKEMVKWAFRKS